MGTTELRDAATGEDLRILYVENIAKGELSDVIRIRIDNPGTVTWTRVRLFVELGLGGFTPNTETGAPHPDVQGKEAMDEKWVEARLIGTNVPVNTPAPDENSVPFQGIGGRYGWTEDGFEEGPTNFLALSDLPVGQYHLVEVRVRVPAGTSTERQAAVSLGVSFKGDMS